MIILINPPFVNKKSAYYMEFCQASYPNPAIGILAGVLYQHQIPYILIDAKLDELSVEETINTIREKLGNKTPTLIGVTCSNTTEIDFDMDTIREIKKFYPHTPLVVGGPHVSALPERTLKDCNSIDIVCIFEGKETLLELYDYYTTKKTIQNLGDIYSIAYRDSNKKIMMTSGRKKNKKRWLNTERPRWEDFSSQAKTYFVFMSIGCPFRCSYCYNVTGLNFSLRNVSTIIDELRYLIKERGMRKFTFADATFAVNRKHTMEVLQRMVDEGLSKGVVWNCWTRVDAIDEELLALMKKSGCTDIALGVESGVDRILERANKKINCQMITKAVNLLKQAKIKSKAFLIFGHIGETIDEVKESIHFIIKLNPDEVGVGVMVPWPGTEIYDLAFNHKEGFKLTSEEFKMYDKYFGNAMINNNIDLKDLESLRVQMYLRLYLDNWRILDLIKFIWRMKYPISKKLLATIQGRLPF